MSELIRGENLTPQVSGLNEMKQKALEREERMRTYILEGLGKAATADGYVSAENSQRIRQEARARAEAEDLPSLSEQE